MTKRWNVTQGDLADNRAFDDHVNTPEESGCKSLRRLQFTDAT